MTKQRSLALARGLLGLVVLVALAWGAVALLSAGVRSLTGVRSDLSTAIVAASATLLVSLLSLITSRYYERRDAIEPENRLKKFPAYENLIAFMFRVLHQGKPGLKKMTEPELVSTYSDLTQKMIVWSSDEVLRRFGDFRVASLQLSEEGGLPGPMNALEDLMLTIRKDLGYRNLNHARGDVLRLFINELAKPQPTIVSGKE